LLQLHLSQHSTCGKDQLGEWDEFAIHNTLWLQSGTAGDTVDSTGALTIWQQNLALLAATRLG